MKNKKFIISIILVAAINLLGVGCWWLVFSGIKKEENSVASTRQEIDISERRLNNVLSLSVLLENIEKDKEKVGAVFLNSKNIVKFIEELEFLSQKTGVVLATKAAIISDNKKPHFEFSINGSFRDTFQYLILLENIPYQISLDNISFILPETEKAKNAKSWEVSFGVNLLSYIP